MKKILSFSTLIIALALFANTNSFAQEGVFKGGIGLGFASDDVGVGIQGGVTYGFTDEIDGAANLTVYFPENATWIDFNVNGHYKFYNEDGTSVYGLGGLNYASVSFDGPGGSVSEVGLNLGGGAEFDTDFAIIFAEIKFVLSSFDKLDLAGGVRFPF